MNSLVRAPLDPSLIHDLGQPQQVPRLGRASVHREVREVAREAAGQLYDKVMSDNLIFERWKQQNSGASAKELERRFVAANWPRCVPFARATLAHMLTLSTVDSSTKERIMSALVKDQQLRVGRSTPQAIAAQGLG